MRYSGIAIEQMRTQSPGVIAIHGSVTTTTAGTIGSTSIPGGGASIVKTATETGRYTITLAPPPAESVAVLANLTFLGGWVSILGADDTVYTTAKGLCQFFRDDDIGGGARDGTIEIQFAEPQTAGADAELMDGVSFQFCIHVGVPAVT